MPAGDRHSTQRSRYFAEHLRLRKPPLTSMLVMRNVPGQRLFIKDNRLYMAQRFKISTALKQNPRFEAAPIPPKT